MLSFSVFTRFQIVFQTVLLAAVLLLQPISALAEEPAATPTAVKPPCLSGFSDVPSEPQDICQAVAYLKQKGFVEGYKDGTYKPGSNVNRAEAAKFVFAPLAKPADLDALASSPSVFEDISGDTWFKKYVEYGRSKGILDGPPKKTKFLGGDKIIKVEFLKMLLLAHGIDPSASYTEIRLPLADDVADADQWFYPYIRYSVAASMDIINPSGLLEPAKQLTRGDSAVLLHRLLMYKEKRRANALMQRTEDEIGIVIKSVEDNLVQAEYASARALLYARGALAMIPDHNVIKGAVKTAEAFRALVRAKREAVKTETMKLPADKEKILGHYDEVIRLAKEAWSLSEKSKEFNPDQAELSQSIQDISSKMAASAREVKKKVEEGTVPAPAAPPVPNP